MIHLKATDRLAGICLDSEQLEALVAAVDKAGLQALTEKEFAKFWALLMGIDAETARAKDDDDTSIKDVVAHRAHWIELFLGWYEDGQAGREVFFPAKGYNWGELKRYNADLRAWQADMGWDGAREALRDAHARLMRFIEGHDDAELYGGPMKGAKNAWTPGRWAEAAGPSHYRSAAKYVRARLRGLAAAGRPLPPK